MINFNKYNPLKLFFPYGIVPSCSFLGDLIGAAGTLFGAKEAAKGQEAAAQTASQAQLEGLKILKEQQARTEESLKPFITGEGGPQSFQMQQALSGAKGPEAQQAAYDQYVESPGVAFLRERGMRGVEQNAAAAGNLYSGNTLKALSQFNQGLALQDFNNYYNRLGSLTGVSSQAAGFLAGVGSTSAAGQANMTAGAGQELAAGQLGKAQTYASAYGNIGRDVGSALNSLGQYTSLGLFG